MKIGIYGSAADDTAEETRAKAFELGKLLAERGHTVITGACKGLPQEAVLGAVSVGGKCIGYSSCVSKQEHEDMGFPTEGFTKMVFIPKDYEHINNVKICHKYRNVSSVASVDAGITIGGRTGTMNEFTILYDLGKHVGVLEGTGGISDRAIKLLLEDIDKESAGTVVFDSNPVRLIEKLEQL